MAARKWTAEQRAKQAALIRTWKPWAHSTGPKSTEGKKISSLNACTWTFREILREIRKYNREIARYIHGQGPAPDHDRTKIDGLLNDLEQSMYKRRHVSDNR
jgi:hypothetical protein